MRTAQGSESCCAYAAPTPILYSYCTLPLHYTSLHHSTLQYTTVHETKRDGTRRTPLSPPPPALPVGPPAATRMWAHKSRGAFRGGGGGAVVGLMGGRIDRRGNDGMTGREGNEGGEQRTSTQLMGLRWAWGSQRGTSRKCIGGRRGQRGRKEHGGACPDADDGRRLIGWRPTQSDHSMGAKATQGKRPGDHTTEIRRTSDAEGDDEDDVEETRASANQQRG